MRIVCVAGFFNPVKTMIDKDLAKEMADKCVLWIPQVSSGEFNHNKLKQALFDAIARGATDVLLLIFLLRGTEYQREIVDSLIAEAVNRSPQVRILADYSFKNARDAAGVVKAIRKFCPMAEKQYPTDLSELSAWITVNHAATLVMHSRAERGVSKSRFEDTRLIYQAVDLLGLEYHAMRTTEPQDAEAKRAACTARLQQLGLDLGPSISISRAGEEGDEYKVLYPPGTEKKRLLDLHLTKGSDRDERFCLRIYFFWDDDAEKVVIGWLPSHLDTRAT